MRSRSITWVSSYHRPSLKADITRGPRLRKSSGNLKDFADLFFLSFPHYMGIRRETTLPQGSQNVKECFPL